MSRPPAPRNSSAPGIERFVLVLALVVPLCVMLVSLAQLSGLNLRLPSMTAYADNAGKIVTHRPAGSTSQAPPTLAPPPTPTPVPAPAAFTPTAVSPRTYTVKPGDELKHIAADYNVSIWKIINANDIPNPDSLRVGQVLKIPDN